MSGQSLGRLVLDPWRGKQRLWIVFWLYWLLGQLAIENAVHLLVAEQDTAIRATLFANGLYSIYSSLSLWRCAWNADYRWLGYPARALALLNLVAAPIALYLAVTGRGIVGP